MIRSLLIVILIVAFLILSIPILIVEWIIGKFNPYARDISSPVSYTHLTLPTIA